MATNHDEAEAVQEKTYKPQRPLSAELLSFNTAGLPPVINFPQCWSPLFVFYLLYVLKLLVYHFLTQTTSTLLSHHALCTFFPPTFRPGSLRGLIGRCCTPSVNFTRAPIALRDAVQPERCAAYIGGKILALCAQDAECISQGPGPKVSTRPYPTAMASHASIL